LDVVIGLMLQGHAMADEEHSSLKCKRRSRIFVFKAWKGAYYRLTKTHLMRFENKSSKSNKSSKTEEKSSDDDDDEETFAKSDKPVAKNTDKSVRRLIAYEDIQDLELVEEGRQLLITVDAESERHRLIKVVHDDPEELEAWKDEIEWRIDVSQRSYRKSYE
jgi:hypothetical protein